MPNIPAVPLELLKQAFAGVPQFKGAMSPLGAIAGALLGRCEDLEIERVIRRYIALKKLATDVEAGWSAKLGGSEYRFDAESLYSAAAAAPLRDTNSVTDSAFDVSEFTSYAVSQLTAAGRA